MPTAWAHAFYWTEQGAPAAPTVWTYPMWQATNAPWMLLILWRLML